MKNLGLFFITVLFGCSTAVLAPSDQRVIEYTFDTTSPKSESFSKGIQIFSKKFTNFSKVLQSQDKEEGTAILKGNVACNVLRQTGDINDYSLKFTLTFLNKDKKTKLKFEDLEIVSETGASVRWAYNQIVDKEKVAQVKVCLDGLAEDTKKSIVDKSGNW